MNAKQLLSETLEELLISKSVEDIYVSDIVKKSGVSRTTFYRHFLDKYDLLSYMYDEICKDTWDTMLEGNTYREALELFYKAITNKKPSLLNALDSSDNNSLDSHALKKAYSTLIEFLKLKGFDNPDEKTRNLLKVYLNGVHVHSRNYLNSNNSESIESHIEILIKSFPSELSKYFI